MQSIGAQLAEARVALEHAHREAAEELEAARAAWQVQSREEWQVCDYGSACWADFYSTLHGMTLMFWTPSLIHLPNNVTRLIRLAGTWLRAHVTTRAQKR